MVKFTVEQVRQIMGQPANIRNISVIAHVDHGKSTLTDALICRAGIISEKAAGNVRATDTRKDQAERGITIKSTGVSLHYEVGGEAFLINLIDSPGHVDFSSQVTAALRVTDGALVVVDVVEGVCAQTETVLRQAMQELIVPLLMVNKMDRAIGELCLAPEQIYQQCTRVIESTNAVLSLYSSNVERLDPARGNVFFGAGKDQWAFSLKTFARMYSKKLGIAEAILIPKLWGEHYYDEETRCFYEEATSPSGKTLQRAFNQFIMEPICRLCAAFKNPNKAILVELLSKLEVDLLPAQLNLEEKELRKLVLSKWLPAADCLLESIICELPSPLKAQQYRTAYLYEGPADDQTAKAMRACDPNGPLCIYISKMVPLESGRFAAFGRIFSGTVRAGERVRIMGAGGEQFERNVGQVGIFMMGKAPQNILDVPCGNTVALLGIDDSLHKSGTIAREPSTQPIRNMKYSVAPVYRVAVRPRSPQDMPALQKGLTKLSKSDPLLLCSLEPTGEIILAGSGELHLEICLNDLKEFAQCEIIVSEPTVTYKETVLEPCLEPHLAKSANHLNRLFAVSEVLDSKLIEALEQGKLPSQAKQRNKALVEDFGWEKGEAVKIWSFEAENVLIDGLRGAQYANEIRESVCCAFREAANNGVLLGEKLQGISFKLTDIKIHPDPPHRNSAQIAPAAKRLFHGLQLASKPTLLQPIFLCEVAAPFRALGGVYGVLGQRRATILEEIKQEDSPLHLIKAYLPVAESFGLAGQLRAQTQGMAFPQCSFAHWKPIRGIPFEDPAATQLLNTIRAKKGMREQLPILKDYVDLM